MSNVVSREAGLEYDWRTNRNPDFAFCQKHFLTYSLNRYEVVKKKPPEKGSIRLIVNCPICFRERRGRMRKLKKTTTNPFSPSLVASSFA